MTDAPPPRARILRRIAGAIGVVEITIGVIALLTILVLVFIQALQRYLPGDGIAWSGEIAKFSLIWLTFSAAGLLITTRGHIALEIMDSLPNPMAVRIVQTFALVCVAVIGFGLTMEAIALIETQGIVKSPVLRIPMSWIYIPVLIGMVSTTIRSAIAAVDIAWHGPVLADVEDTIEGASA
ncbi:TRAP transporter small permease [Agromyces archimandritae]|uniref:TRAP transporter small permease n=1 Tax=Agromyces archimandritae TaxID=2781962 RepID=A0A975FKA5_9MICO|nr:TRAP transporter small permease [Agromyces archimandritae]QTX03539.1 TRAP transporter small permease [Agromyces archimandritae]